MLWAPRKQLRAPVVSARRAVLGIGEGGGVGEGGGCDTRSHVVSELVEEVWLMPET